MLKYFVLHVPRLDEFSCGHIPRFRAITDFIVIVEMPHVLAGTVENDHIRWLAFQSRPVLAVLRFDRLTGRGISRDDFLETHVALIVDGARQDLRILVTVIRRVIAYTPVIA